MDIDKAINTLKLKKFSGKQLDDIIEYLELTRPIFTQMIPLPVINDILITDANLETMMNNLDYEATFRDIINTHAILVNQNITKLPHEIVEIRSKLETFILNALGILGQHPLQIASREFAGKFDELELQLNVVVNLLISTNKDLKQLQALLSKSKDDVATYAKRVAILNQQVTEQRLFINASDIETSQFITDFAKLGNIKDYNSLRQALVRFFNNWKDYHGNKVTQAQQMNQTHSLALIV